MDEDKRLDAEFKARIKGARSAQEAANIIKQYPSEITSDTLYEMFCSMVKHPQVRPMMRELIKILQMERLIECLFFNAIGSAEKILGEEIMHHIPEDANIFDLMTNGLPNQKADAIVKMALTPIMVTLMHLTLYFERTAKFIAGDVAKAMREKFPDQMITCVDDFADNGNTGGETVH